MELTLDTNAHPDGSLVVAVIDPWGKRSESFSAPPHMKLTNLYEHLADAIASVVAMPVQRMPVGQLPDQFRTGTFGQVVRHLASRPTGGFTPSELASKIFSGPETPMWPEKSIASAISRNRHKLEPFGWQIQDARGSDLGYSLFPIAKA